MIMIIVLNLPFMHFYIVLFMDLRRCGAYYEHFVWIYKKILFAGVVLSSGLTLLEHLTYIRS
jgi:hypothetical protein